MSSAATLSKPAASTLKIEQCGAYLGAKVTGIDLSKPVSDADIDALKQAHAEHGLLIFRDQDMTASDLIAFGKRFGPLTVHPFAPNAGGDRPELITFRNDENNPPYGTDCWHSDETFRVATPMGTMLRATDVPAFGGDTMFASMAAAWDGLSDRMQHFLSGLEAWHDFKVFKPLFGASAEGRKQLREFEEMYPPVLHPVVTKHPVTDRKVIFVNPQFTVGIKGMEEAESQALLKQLYDLALVPEYQFRHKWKNNTLIFWDNRSTQHYAVHDYFPKRRYMERVTIGGTQPLAAFEPADLKLVRNRKARKPDSFDGQFAGHAPKKAEGGKVY